MYFNSLVKLTVINLFVCFRHSLATLRSHNQAITSISTTLFEGKTSEYWRPGEKSNRIILVIRHFHELPSSLHDSQMASKASRRFKLFSTL